MRALAAILLTILLIAGCAAPPPGKSLVLVTVGGNAACIDDLQFTLTLADGRTTMGDARPAQTPFSIPPSQEWAIEFDAGITGKVHLKLDAKTKSGDVLASDVADAVIDPATMPTVSMTLNMTGFRKLDPGVTDPGGIDLHGVWAQKGEVIAVGLRRGAMDGSRAVSLRSTDRGCTWTSLNLGGNYGLFAVGGDADRLYIVGENGTILRRANGGQFTSDAAADHSTLLTVARVPSGGDSFAAGNSNISFYRSANDGNWAIESNSTGYPGYGVFPINSSLVYIVGDGGSLSRGPGNWMLIATPAVAALRAFWASAPDDLWMVGDDGSIYHGSDDGNFSSLMDTNVALAAVWGAKAGDVWIAGDAGHLYRSDGTNVTPVPSSGTTDPLLAVYGDGTDLYAVGKNGAIVRGP